MDIQNLTAALQDFRPKEYTWTFALYSAHKSRDGLQLSWNACAMREIPRWTEVLARTLLEKSLTERGVTEYSPLLPKEQIGVLERGSELIRGQMSDMLLGITGAQTLAPEDFANGVVSRPAGYAFYGVRPVTPEELEADGQQKPREIIFMRRGNPFITGAKMLLCTGQNGGIAESEAPLLKFTPQTDFLLIEDMCCFISESIAKDFDLESRPNAVCARRLEQIAESDVVGCFEALEMAALSGKNTRKFLDFDREILTHIAGLSIEARMDFLGTYGVELDANGKMNTADPEQCELIIDLLCGRSCLDVLGRLAVGLNIKPRE
ncbi:MAG: hypothetical protein FWH26_10170 [Oscillospiraceae bacterium]|nr:hypothetical protein [Oscillospiraceae bacterium]